MITHADIRQYLGLHYKATRLFLDVGVPLRGPLTELQVEAVLQGYRRRQGEAVLWASRADAAAILERLREARAKMRR